MAQVNLSEMQKAVYAKIAVSALTTALGGAKVYDRVPSGIQPSYPYVTFGPPVTSPQHNQDTAWMDMLFQIDVWHRDASGNTGKKKVYEIQDLIRSLLDRQRLTIAGANHLYTQERTVTIVDGSDGITFHGVQVYAIGASPTL